MSRGLVLIALLLCTTAHAGVRVQDSAGRIVTLDQPARRIIALAPHIVENLYSAGAGDRIVGTVDYANFPHGAENIPTLGSAHAWSLESLVALEPDLVVLWESGSGLGALPQLERLGLTVYVSEPRQLSDITDNIRDFGLLAGTTPAAEASVIAFATAMAELEAAYGKRSPLSVFYQIWNRPLQTINGEHLISAVMRICGAGNLFSDMRQLAPRVSLESVLERDPDVIVTSGMGESRPEWLDSWRQYPQLTAVKNDALLHVHPDLIQRPTVRIARGAALLCTALDNVRGPAGR